MRTAIDTPILLDVLSADAEFGRRSRQALRQAYSKGALVVSSVVWAEVCAAFADLTIFHSAMRQLGARHSPISDAAAELAGQRWKQQKNRGSLAPHFLIGAHALIDADALLTRDRNFYRVHFSELALIEPG